MSSSTEAPAHSIVTADVEPHRWMALGVVLLAAVMDIIDTSIVLVAIPSIRADLGASYTAIQWTVAGYTLAFALGLITGGRLGDIFGRKRMFLLGVAGFTAASALSGLAVNPAMLVAARVLQGAMAALMVPQVLSILQVSFRGDEQRKAYGAYGAMLGVGAVAGPLLGGLLIGADLFGLGWRPIFLINLPVGIFALFAAAALVRESRSPFALRLDLIGAMIVTIGLLAIVYPLVQGRALGWPAWGFASMAASIPILGLFALYERRKTRIDGSPLVVLGLFRQRAFVAGLAVSLIFFSGIAGFFLVLMIYLQAGLGFSALRAGLTVLPFEVGLFIASGLSVQLAPRMGRTVTSLGALLMAVGMGGLMVTIDRYGTGIGPWQFLPALIVCGLGLGMVAPTLVDVILAGVSHRDAGSASGVLNTNLQLGGTIGVALIGVIFFGVLGTEAAASAEAVAPRIRSGLAAEGVSVQIRDQIVSGFASCFDDRMSAEDPSAIPASCRSERRSSQSSETDAAIRGVIESAAAKAREGTFSETIKRTLPFEIAVFLSSFMLIFLLPKAPRSYAAEDPAVPQLESSGS
jgi:EmrB/QacA subfamily drug resistance transporter